MSSLHDASFSVPAGSAHEHNATPPPPASSGGTDAQRSPADSLRRNAEAAGPLTPDTIDGKTSSQPALGSTYKIP